ncbi:transcriptional regulator, DeoR family [Clostridium pasteurianum DSM 525 = ATCC 6013]|uniref:Transcriptional regulator, DeoR family n=1 Tax=Clostridium pasteurianum DSM 525 = ATCC 6013 TaxID=1262449 RepID=A0A0H3J7F1_CLOPA|nr:DeoR/GlpR family DNA-binding transcription regulator [Clostridium pasteurianum]AJA46915.1 transcriptional regulator, DeoR family [Clostridium pasteurianum DSM 525 = ATCC 6013]AJA50903.1 transcriptional regulator, DeoR family [Clostridium pasteurianum DSM 525 = ATCC 6013]AOZ74299.1 DeoR family transcriptional regulator [Clostridium pasteurianum DSM 525 = ATCC 6013]AOZ78097.1 DeoR family transcriptional regulator [Clostridium pasteurianum]ELP58165.1 DeoR family transcriptional regulator [Clos
MGKTNSIVSKRREKILEYLRVHEELSNNDLSEKLKISPLTLRRDLQALDDEGLITRFYGGAKLIDAKDTLNHKRTHNDINLQLKLNSIAKYAADLVQDGDTIFMNSSSTVLLMLKYLKNKRVNVVTNNGKALNENIDSNVELVLTGGQVYERKQSLVGDFATYILSKITADKCFLGVSGISYESGISTSVLQETLVNHEMIKRCGGPVYILADSSKVGRHHNFSSGDINEISDLITDSDIDKNEIENFQSKNVNVITINYRENSYEKFSNKIT